jgi:phosphodiesterase/alkaline phosphatase D-like protein
MITRQVVLEFAVIFSCRLAHVCLSFQQVSNNWFPGEILGPPQYPDGTQASDLAERSLQAFYEHNPIKEGARIFRTRKFGKHLEIFFLDLRSFRDPNTDNIDPAGDAMMGREQLEWLKNSLSASTATWKVISTHDPLSIVTGGPGDYDSYSQGDPAILGRELELKELFDHINENDIHDVVFLTSDVHFTAAIEYSKSRATGTINRFNNFWEFVIGPINAGAFGPNSLDSSFGPKFDYVLAPATEGFKGQNLPPPYLQSFGYASVSANGELSLSLMGINGDELYSKKFTRTELPITESDVFIQTGEVSTDSVIVNGRCNVPTNPDPLAFVTYTGLGLSQTISLGRTRRSNDFTVKTKISGLSPATTYTVQIQCDNRYFSQVATFMTAAAPDSPSAVSFVWAADLVCLHDTWLSL